MRPIKRIEKIILKTGTMDKTVDQYRTNLFELQEREVRMNHEDWTEEKIKQRCAELKNHIIDSESINNRFRNPVLQKIWSSPPRIKRNY